MSSRKREEITLDGITVRFNTSATYVPNTLFLIRNGQVQAKEYVTELGGTLFEIEEALDSDEIAYVDYQPLL